MGKKVNPFGFRLGTLYSWKSRWFANQHDYKDLLLQDLELRKFVMAKLKNAGIIKVDIERSIKKIKIFVHVSRPGVVIGKGGSGMEALKKEIMKKLRIKENDPKAIKLDVKVEEVKNPNAHAHSIAQRLSDQLIGRYPHRRAVNQAIDNAMDAGVKGVKIQLAGRIGGAEIARVEKYGKGTVPSQTIRADIDYAEMPALTKSGYVGIKVWVNNGEQRI